MARDVLLLPNWAIIHETKSMTAVYAACCAAPLVTIAIRDALQKLTFNIPHKWEHQKRSVPLLSRHVRCLEGEEKELLRGSCAIVSQQGIPLDEYTIAGFTSGKPSKEDSFPNTRTTRLHASGVLLESCLHAFANTATGIGANRSEELIN